MWCLYKSVLDGKTSRISVLLIPQPDPTHVFQMSAIGEALVRRGHNVTLCTTEIVGNDLVQRVTAQTGMSFLSAGPDPAFPTKEDYVDHYTAVQDMSPYHSAVDIILYQLAEGARSIVNKLTSDPSFDTSWDIVIADFMFAAPFACLSMEWGVPHMSFQPGLDFLNLPTWSFPVYGSGYTDDLSFLQRLNLISFRAALSILAWYMRSTELETVDIDCSAYYNPAYYAMNGYAPTIVSTAIGFEYPRTLTSMHHYVGPLILKSSEEFSDELQEFLVSKKEKSVIYISMGSTAHLTQDMANAIVSGIMQTHYSVIWSLRNNNRNILEKVQIDEGRFYISNWLPQQAVLKSDAIALAILHGGMGGVSEALYNAVPIIVMPFAVDQYDNAARVQHAGVGVRLDANALSSEKVQTAIEIVSALEYKRAAEKMQKIFIHAGGAERAADLVEFYGEVGYDHLIPAYAKYEWSWVQYYNVDVYITLLSSLLLAVFAISRIASCACKWCRVGKALKVV